MKQNEYDLNALLIKFAKDAGVQNDMSLLEALKTIANKALPMMEATNSAILLFEKLGKGAVYNCPHCQSATLLEFGNCHVCEGNLFVETLNVIEKKTKKETKSAKNVEVVEEAVVVTEKQKREPSDFTKEELEILLAKTNDKKNKSDGLMLIADTLSIVLPKPELMTTPALRTEISKGIQALIDAKKKAKVVEVEEAEVLAEDDDSDIILEDEDDNGDDVVESTDDDEEEITPQNPKKLAKDKKPAKEKPPKKTKVEPVVEDDEELILEDDEEEKPAKTTKEKPPKKKTPPKKEKVEVEDADADLEDDDETFSLDSEDTELDAIEVEDDIMLEDDEEDIED